MSNSGVTRNVVWVGLLVGALVVACDLPTTAPTLETETGVNAPVVVGKTFFFLGGPESEYEPLIDTTTSRFDSLFTVSGSEGSISIEEEVSSFDLGSLDQALDEAAEGVGMNTSLSETVIQGSDLATQDVNVDRIREENGTPPPTPSEETTVPVVRDTIPFPPELLAVPDFEIAAIQADTVRRGTLTSETDFEGTPVNRITFTLFNDPSHSTPLTDGNGNPPSVTVRDEEGVEVASASFGSTIEAGESESVELEVKGETLGQNSEVVLTVEGNDSEDGLTIALSPLRYQEVTLADIDQAQISATRTELSTQGGDDSQFAGIVSHSGTLQLEITNNLQFPIEIDSLLLENHLQGSALPDSFEVLDVFRSAESISAGATRRLEVDLAGRGIASGVDVRVKATPDGSPNVLTAADTDNIKLSASGSLSIGTLYFWPTGEELTAGGTFNFQQDRISFDRPEDYMELEGGILSLTDIMIEPTVGFESLRLSFPDIRSAPYGKGDSLTVPVSVETEGKPQVGDVDLADLRLLPAGNAVDFHVQGTLESIPSSKQNVDNLRVIRRKDAVRADVSVGQLDVRALKAGVTPFSVDVTEDVNGDGRLNLADTLEATRESFDGFGGIAESTEGLQLTGSELKFRVTTDAGTDARLYAALQGRRESSRTFLAGKGNNRVPASAPLGDDFYDGSTQIPREDLIRVGIDGAPTNSPVTRSITLTGDNSTVDDFVSSFPSSLRLVAQARVLGNDNGRIRLRRPLQFDSGLSVSIPVRVNGAFAVEDTVEADFSALEDLTDPEKTVQVTGAELRVKYENALPLGTEAQFVVLDEDDNEVLTLPGSEETVRLRPAPKGSDGTARGTQTGKTTLTLSKQEVQDLTTGRSLHLLLNFDQAEEGGPATIRATDTIELSLEATVQTSVRAN